MLPGETAFKLYDTYGFPFDLTEDALRARGIGGRRQGLRHRDGAPARRGAAAWTGSGEAATETCGSSSRKSSAPTEFLGYDAEGAEGEIVALVKDGKRVSSQGRRARHRPRQPDALLCGIGGQVGDRGLIASPRRRASTSRTPRRSCTACSCIGRHRSRHAEVGEVVRSRSRSFPPHRDARQSFRHASPARGAARGAWAARCSEGLAGRARAGSASTSPITRPMTPAEIRAVEDLANAMVSARTSGDDASDASRRGDRQGRDGAVRREIRRRGPRRQHGQERGERQGRACLFGRAVRRHPCAPHRRYRPVQDRRRKRGCLRRPPHRGAHGRGRALLSRHAGCARARGSGTSEGRLQTR